MGEEAVKENVMSTKGRKGDFNSSRNERDRRRFADDAMRAGE